MNISSMRAALGHREFKPGVGAVVSFLLFVLLGALLVAYPAFALALLGVLCFVGAVLLTVRRAGFKLWQVLLLAALSGYCIVGYGFENIAFHLGGIPIPIGHLLMFAALGLAVRSFPDRITKLLREPALLCLLSLILLALLHLVFDVPRYGFYAVRDASMFVEGIFLFLGLLWAADRRNTAPLMKWLLFLFLLNLIYGYTFPWADKLTAWSPRSGVFLQVPVLGGYSGTARYFAMGALFCLWLARYITKWPRWIIYVLAAAQLFGLAIHQVRSTYIDIASVLILLMFLGEARKWAGLVTTLALGLLTLLFLAPVLAKVAGRVGPVDLAFLEQHAESSLSILKKPAAHDPIEGSIYDRQEWNRQVWRRIQSSTANLWVGEGFGQPLIEFYFARKYGGSAVAVRQPHNSNLSVLARLGVLGLTVWALFHWFILKRFAYVFRRRHRLNKKFRDLVLWLFVFYVAAMIHAFVQPEFEFSSGAITFYFMMGFALGLIRWQVRNAVLDRTAVTYCEGMAK